MHEFLIAAAIDDLRTHQTTAIAAIRPVSMWSITWQWNIGTRVISHQRYLGALVLAQQIGIGEPRFDDLAAIGRNYFETHAMQMNGMLVLGHVFNSKM